MSKLLATGKTDLLDKFVSNARGAPSRPSWPGTPAAGKVGFEFEPRESKFPPRKTAAAKKAPAKKAAAKKARSQSAAQKPRRPRARTTANKRAIKAKLRQIQAGRRSVLKLLLALGGKRTVTLQPAALLLPGVGVAQFDPGTCTAAPSR
jgi:DNA topoisomerase III